LTGRVETIGTSSSLKPQTGAEYLQSPRDGREVYIYAEQCLAEYDLDGWTVPDLTDPGELSHHALRGRR
jgi:hypothetical protein